MFEDALLKDEIWDIIDRDDSGFARLIKVRDAQHLATLKAVVEWLDDLCREHTTHIDPQMVRRIDCLDCWQALKKSMEE